MPFTTRAWLRGTVGTTVHVFETPNRAFEVEFTDDDGGTVAFVTLLAAALRPA
jgi:hypothetical protein